jgi:hypothetical protein|nr:MAG TPA: hypothetical protein [Caudoviricetes sp.]
MLRTDYKADVFEGNRKYQISTDAQGKSEIMDVTAYSQEGDVFGPEDINAANTEINRMTREVELTLRASGWSASAPYTQTVDVPGLKETDKVQMMSAIKTDTAVATANTWDKMGALVKAGKALDGQAVFACPKKKPTSDFNIKLVGVSANE